MNILIECPHCQGMVEIIQIGCAIFRHGIYIQTQQQLNPHASKEICEDAIAKKLIYGCGKPFKIENIDNNYLATKCNYI